MGSHADKSIFSNSALRYFAAFVIWSSRNAIILAGSYTGRGI